MHILDTLETVLKSATHSTPAVLVSKSVTHSTPAVLRFSRIKMAEALHRRMLEQDVFHINNNNQVHDDNASSDNDGNVNDDASLALIPSIRPTASWETVWCG
jgi:hypothetical protein